MSITFYRRCLGRSLRDVLAEGERAENKNPFGRVTRVAGEDTNNHQGANFGDIQTLRSSR